jgi:hypothetical protein
MDWIGETIAALAQGAFFMVGLTLSLLVGMVLAAHADGPGGLLIATVISGAGLLAAAGFSQSLREFLLDRRAASRNER